MTTPYNSLIHETVVKNLRHLYWIYDQDIPLILTDKEVYFVYCTYAGKETKYQDYPLETRQDALYITALYRFNKFKKFMEKYIDKGTQQS